MRARKIDRNHTEIRAYFESLGFRTHSTRGDWDITAQTPGGNVTFLIEVKYGNEPLTENEEGWHKKLNIFIVRNLEDASNLANLMVKHDLKIRAGT